LVLAAITASARLHIPSAPFSASASGTGDAVIVAAEAVRTFNNPAPMIKSAAIHPIRRMIANIAAHLSYNTINKSVAEKSAPELRARLITR
jgi:hypothetical protein